MEGPRDAVESRPLTARDLLRRALPVVTPDQTVELVWSRLQREGCERAAVADADGLLGIVELQDLWVTWALGLGGGSRAVVTLVAPAPLVAADAPLLAVCQALRAATRGAVLVQSTEDGQLLGALTAADVVLALTEVASC